MNEKHRIFRLKSREVDSLVLHHGISFLQACELVSLSPRDYHSNTDPLEWLPSPEAIEKATIEIQRRPDFDPLERRQWLPTGDR